MSTGVAFFKAVPGMGMRRLIGTLSGGGSKEQRHFQHAQAVLPPFPPCR